MAEAVEKTDMLQSGGTRHDGIALDEDRNTFLPRPSDDPNDPLNFPLWLKVCSYPNSGVKSLI
jgi:hypothetical protein